MTYKEGDRVVLINAKIMGGSNAKGELAVYIKKRGSSVFGEAGKHYVIPDKTVGSYPLDGYTQDGYIVSLEDIELYNKEELLNEDT